MGERQDAGAGTAAGVSGAGAGGTGSNRAAHADAPLRVAAIDLGTVSSRLSLACVRDGAIVDARKHTIIIDLGEGVDATGRFCEAAVERVVAACREFLTEIEAFAPVGVCCTLTSAARDAHNGDVLLDALRDLGLVPQVIPGEVEARLTFYGVAHDFANERIAVADSGGGSTELAVGRYAPGSAAALTLDHVRSINIGCRRVTERYLRDVPPTEAQLDEARAFAHGVFVEYWSGLAARPDRLVAVGGTVTTLVAMVHELAVYDPAFVHLHALSLAEVEGAIARMRGLSTDGIAQLPGVQAKRAPVLLAGAAIIAELMRTGGYDALTVSENSLLAGMAATMYETIAGEEPAIGWRPELSGR